MPWADVLYACDRTWWNAYYDRARRECEGVEFWTCNREASKVWGLNYIEAEPGGVPSLRPRCIPQGGDKGGNSGFQALALALHFGAARVILLGYDMQFTGRRKHWHPDHRGTMHNPQNTEMRYWPQFFARMAAAVDVPIVNATRETALKCFARLDLVEALAVDTSQPSE